MKVLSLFDGMACGMLAMLSAGIKVDRYVAYEIDKYATQTSSHNFPMIEHRGDVFQADFTEYSGFDFLVGGSPCTYWSIAQKNNRETEASGMGWELFSQYVRALKEAKPMWFIYENNKSMSKAIRESITDTFGFEPICINSALVSAQNRQRLYWVGRRNPDGTYSKVKVDQPEDRGILLRDVLDGLAWQDKSYTIDSNYHKTLGQQGFDKQSGRRKMVAEPIKALTEKEMDYMVRQTSGGRNHFDFGYIQDATKDKGACLTANVSKGVPYNVCCVPIRIPEYGDEDKARPLGANYSNNCGGFEHRMFSDKPNKQQVDMVAQPVGINYVGEMPEHNGNYYNGKQPSQQYRVFDIDGKGVAVTTTAITNVAIPLRIGTYPNDSKNQEHDSQQYRIYSTDGKGVTLCGNGGGMGAKTGLYAIPVEYDGDIPTKAISCADGKTYPVYQVKDGQITIKGKQYPIKLADGWYIIRKLTVSECKRLQTVPEWYEFPVSDTQAYKMLGNGWTVEVIAHLINATQADELDEDQLDLFKMWG